MPMAFDCELLLYGDDTCLLFMGKDTKAIKDKLNRDFCSLCEWFVDNKLNIHFERKKLTSIFLGN